MGDVVYLNKIVPNKVGPNKVGRSAIPLNIDREFEKSRLRRRAMKFGVIFFLCYFALVALCVYLRSLYGTDHPVLSMLALMVVILPVMCVGTHRFIGLSEDAMAEPEA
jgi:Flp pilus assembly protein TadB